MKTRAGMVRDFPVQFDFDSHTLNSNFFQIGSLSAFNTMNYRSYPCLMRYKNIKIIMEY